MKKSYEKDSIAYGIDAKPTVTLDVDLDRFSNGWLHMAITEVKIKQAEKEVGSISVGVQGTAVHAKIGSRTWSIPMTELWPIFADADEKYLKENK